MDCPNCGDHTHDEYANYCPTCGNHLKQVKNRSSAQTAAGVLTILASCISGAVGMLLFFPFTIYLVRATASTGPVAVILLFELAAFFLGLLSGIFILRKQYFSISLIGASFVIVSGFMFSFIPFIGIALAVPLLFFSILALILVAVSRREFV